jgi:hypothetical protein
MKLTSILIGFLPLTLAAACGGSSSDDDGESVPLEELPAAYAEAYCDALERCAGPLLDIFLAGEDCVALTTTRVQEELPNWQAAIDDGRMTYHGEQVETCVADIGARSCEAFNERGGDACSAVFEGATAVGQPCTLGDECAGDARCEFDSGCPGRCAPLGGEGEDCGENDDCASGLVCNGTCEQPAGAGDLCQAGNADCSLGYLCVGADEANGLAGNCRTYDEVFAGGQGEGCDIAGGEWCSADLVCQVDTITADGIEASCAANVGSAEPCRLAVPDQCPDDEFCDVPAMMIEGTCKPRPTIGQACAGLGGDVCAAGARCNAGTCKGLTALGGSCADDDVCYSENCSLDGECVSGNSCE